MKETGKASLRRSVDIDFLEQYFSGNGIDIGAGEDGLSAYMQLFPKINSVKNWDLVDGDAQFLPGVDDKSYDFVYSSHCLEHMVDPLIAIDNWLRVLKPGGHLIVTVPDEDMYEHGVWPSKFNSDHKWSFTLYKPNSGMPKSINLTDLAKNFFDKAEIRRLAVLNREYKIGNYDDQSLGSAECSLEFVLQKKLDSNDCLRRAFEFDIKGETQKALEFYELSIQKNRLNIKGYELLSNLLIRHGNVPDAKKVLEICRINTPDDRNSHYIYALLLIALGEFDHGFDLREKYISGFHPRSHDLPEPINIQRWHGESLIGKSIVIWTEFGAGDEIMFSRFVSVFKNQLQAKRVILVCREMLVDFLSTLIDVDLVVSPKNIDLIGSPNYWIYPHSIPTCFSLEKHGVPNNIPYLSANSEKIEYFRALLPTSGNFKIGFVMQGDPTHENDNARSIHDPELMQEIFNIPRIDWISLQKNGLGSSELPLKIHDSSSCTFIGSRLLNYSDTAAVCSNLDLVISVDTSVAHVCGALGVDTWLILPAYSDWRWGIGDKSPWYPQMTLFRQKNHFIWDEVMAGIRNALITRLT